VGRVAGSGIYYNAYDGYTVAIEKTNAEEFAAYLSKLAELGYTRYDENSIGMVDFYTYVKGNATLYVQYNTADKTDGPMARMTLTYDEWLPPTEEVTEYQTLADASINYLALAPGAGGSGLSMIFQLPDGSFFTEGRFFFMLILPRFFAIIEKHIEIAIFMCPPVLPPVFAAPGVFALIGIIGVVITPDDADLFHGQAVIVGGILKNLV
jgi:hypothetical protein